MHWFWENMEILWCKFFHLQNGESNKFDIIKAIINNEKISVPVSVLLNGEYGISDVSLGIPTQINKGGISKIEEINLDKSELDLLHKSADTIKEYINSC